MNDDVKNFINGLSSYRDLCFSEWLKHEISEGTCLLANDDEFRKLENGQHIPL